MSPTELEGIRRAIHHLRRAEVEAEAARQALAQVSAEGADAYQRLLQGVDRVRSELGQLLTLIDTEGALVPSSDGDIREALVEADRLLLLSLDDLPPLMNDAELKALLEATPTLTDDIPLLMNDAELKALLDGIPTLNVDAFDIPGPGGEGGEPRGTLERPAAIKPRKRRRK